MVSTLTVLQVNDTHGYLNAHPELFWSGSGAEYRIAGGYARLSALIKQIRQETHDRVLLFDGGDTFHGTYPVVKTKGEALIPILNHLGFAAMTGHWDFAYGPARLRELAAGLNYPMLAVNCFDKGTHERVFPAHIVHEVGDLRVGVIGIAATIVDKTMPQHFSEGIYLTLGKEELPDAISHLRDTEHVDLIVVVSHLGFPQDLQIADDVDGIDILLSAHTHNRVYRPVQVNKTFVIQSGCHGSFLGRLDLTIDSGRITDCQHALITVDESIAADQEAQEIVDAALRPFQYLREVVGRTDVALNRNTVLEATMDNFLLNALMRQTQAQVAFSNGWRYGAPIPAGDVTLNDLYNITPMNPPIATVNLTGEEIQTMLEENLEHTFSRSPYQQMGGYLKRIMGLTIYVKIENPHGQRIQQIFVQDRPLELKRTYPAVFVTEQGVSPRFGTDRQQHDIHAVDAMRDLLRYSTTGWQISGRVVAV